jgi:hypothetical protein
MVYRLLADLIVAVHVAYVGYVVIGQLLIWIGIPLRWRWVRNPWFRWTHLAMIGIVALEAVFGLPCPLTEWERDLRIAAGQQASGESFIGRLLHDLIHFNAPEWVFPILHIGFALLVLGTFFLFPPRFRRSRRVS